MIIEFCGIPGGGKSTLAKAYAKSHASSTTLVALDMYKRLPEATYGILFAIRHPQTFFWLCVFVVRYSVRGLFLYSFHLMVRACAKYQKATHVASTKIALVDEGLVHAIMTLSTHSFKAEELCRWMRRMVLPDVVCIAQDGDFHRFHNSHAILHPRVRTGGGALQEWEIAVSENVRCASQCLEVLSIPAWYIPEKITSTTEENAESLQAYLATR